MRVDTWIRHSCPWLPYGSIQKALRRGLIKLDETKVTPATRLTGYKAVYIHSKWLASFQRPEPRSGLTSTWQKRVESWILYEDDHLIVLNKPQGIACQGGSGQTYHLDEIMKSFRPEESIRLIHRLDIETTGVLIMARTLLCAQTLSESFRDKQIGKTYWALVHGHPRSRGNVDFSLERQGPRMIVSRASTALPSFTSYKTKETFISPEGDYFAWIELLPRTGRMHQLRTHMASIDHPIVGDLLYGSPMKGPIALHCHSLSFTYNNQKYFFQAPAPLSFEKRKNDLQGKTNIKRA